MIQKLRIFIGSSKEGEAHAKKISALLFDAGGESITIRGWWNGVFRPGVYYMDSLAAVMRETDAAIFIATPDDKTSFRGKEVFQARDNVIVELGMSVTAHSLQRTAVAMFALAKLPSDLDGVTHFKVTGKHTDSDFVERNRAGAIDLLDQWRKHKMEAEPEVKTVLPKLYEVILRVLGSFKNKPPQIQGLDLVASALLDSIARQFTEGNKESCITESICSQSEGFLKGADAIWALDVLGPSAWLTPTAFRYLATQIRHYFRANDIRENKPFTLSASVATAIRRASRNMMRISGRQSTTKFDDRLHRPRGKVSKEDFQWVEGKPGLEFTRIVLWTEAEFRTPIAESVINIHEAFHVPLFGLLVRPNATERAFDFIAFRQSNGRLNGFYNRRSQGFIPKNIDTGKFLDSATCLQYWKRILSHKKLMFAADIYDLLANNPKLKRMP